MRRRIPLIVLTATFGITFSAGAVLAAPAAPAAQEPEIRLTELDGQPSVPLTVDGLVPGDAVVHGVVITSTSDLPDADLTLTIDSLVDAEQGCGRQEVMSGDDSCDEDEGELSQLLLASARLVPTDGCQSLASDDPADPPGTSLADLAGDAGLSVAGILPSGDSRCMALRFDLPSSAGNLIQSDGTSFDLRVTAEQAFEEPAEPEDPEVLEEVVERPSEGASDDGEPSDDPDVRGEVVEASDPDAGTDAGPGQSDLAKTGAPIGLLLVAALLLSVLGVIAIRTGAEHG